MNAIDLFAGPGGLDLAAEALDIHVLGIELDDDAVATRKAAGLTTLQGNVAQLDPLDYADHADGVMGGPPCPTFSMAGKGSGRDDLSLLQRAVYQLARGNPAWRETAGQCKDERTPLVLEPLRWAFALSPQWIVLEQVPPVLPIWEMTAIALQGRGYNVWTGLVYAEQYGVPQTRKRALLLARLGEPVGPPPPTHQRYDARHPRSESLCGGLRPWVSMAEALGWAGTAQVGFPRRADRGASTEDGYRERDLRSGAEPAFAVGGKTRSWQRRELVNGTGANAGRRLLEEPAPTVHFGARLNTVEWRMRAGGQPNQAARGLDQPAPTIIGGHDTANRQWVPTVINTGRDWRAGKDRDSAQTRTVDAPAPTVSGADTQARWEAARPATTVSTDNVGRVHPPGHKMNAADAAAGREYNGRNGREATRVTIAEASILQTFPADYPWQGSRSSQYQQVGNAVPPLLGLHAIAAASGREL